MATLTAISEPPTISQLEKKPPAGTGKMRSVEASRAVWNSKAQLSRGELLIMQALASHANEAMECWPGLDRLAGMTRYTKRQVIRIISSLEAKGQIAVDRSPGGLKKCNHYRLLVAVNGDIQNSDIPNGDTRNSDIPKANGDIPDRQTVTIQHPNSGEMSPEWVEGFYSEWREWFSCAPRLFSPGEQDHSSKPELFLHYTDIESLIEEANPEHFLRRILNGTPVHKTELCECHGPFTRAGYRFGNWIAWAGHDNVYGGNRRNAGCEGCRLEWEQLAKGEPKRKCSGLPVREFDLRTPAGCGSHGNFILFASLTEYSEEYGQLIGNRYRLSLARHSPGCPECEGDVMYEMNVQHDLGLSNEEWERGGEQILAALDYARGNQ